MYSIKKLMVKIIMTINKGQSYPPVCLTFLCTAQKQSELLLGGDRRAEIAASDYSDTLGILS